MGAIQQGIGQTVPAGPAAATEDLRARVAALHWWHHIDLGGGLVTPGISAQRHQDWISGHLPPRFDGLSVLDVGAWDGYYSFLAEERGARRVLAIDRLQNLEAHASGYQPFELAKSARGSGVEYRVMDVSELDRLPETFDVVFFLGVYYHLRDPWKALEVLRRRLAPGGRVFAEGLLLPGSRPVVRFFHPPELEETTYCAATESGLVELAHLAGFPHVRTLSRHEGLGSLPFALWRWIPKGMKFGGVLNPQSTSVQLVGKTRILDGAWPRILMEFGPG
ncbi:MAG TPA: class I SAM-dependent methyltransferase [Thermoplasmata archaeon]|nr:class I SAM-dependent methyltransferase [Thermoplasmata archaeon]